ncbi:MAG TPA: hypothetical protein VD886_00395 [Herpetosiphonaceae bacterium]|nr:hypothetical protein [Herpetosiphonaceae bacterium]
MTLSVDRCRYVDDELIPIDWDYPETLAGFEDTRCRLWGSAALIALGARMLPELRNGDIYCYPERLDQLEADIRLVLGHLDELACAAGYGSDYIAERATNILNAVLWARRNAGGVIIW